SLYGIVTIAHCAAWRTAFPMELSMTVFPRHPLKTLLIALTPLAFSPALLAAEGPPGHTHGETAAIGEPAKATANTRTVEVSLVDIAFEPESIKVKAGETVRFKVTNKGQLLHEFNLGTPAMHAEHQKEMAMMMDHGMIT